MSSTGALTLATEASQQQRSVKKVYALSGNLAYGKQKLLFDIAILEVNLPFILNSKVVAAKLPTARTAVGTNLQISGWGTISDGNEDFFIALSSNGLC